MISKMKRKTLIKIAGIMVLCFVVFEGVFGYIKSQHMARNDFIPRQMNSVALAIECYKSENGVYPNSLETLLSFQDTDVQEMLRSVLNDKYHDKYDFKLLSNGYVITVNVSSDWLNKRRPFQKKYLFGEVNRLEAVTNLVPSY